MFKNILTVTRRELSAYFDSAIAYIFATVFVLLNCGLYMTQFFLAGRADLRPFFTLMPFLLAIFIPAIAMRLWAEERRGNTLEMLLTFPMRTQELVLGKFFAALAFYLTALAGTLTLPLMLFVLGRPDAGAMAGGYLGAVLMGAFFLAAGLFVSGFLRDQITAFILGMMICFTFYFAGTDFVAASIDGWLPGLGTFIRQFAGAARHFDSFAKGVVDTRDVLYFVFGTGLFLWLNAFWLEGRMRAHAGKLFSGAVILSAGIFLAANHFAASFNLGRFDWTEGRIYTVSDASRNILRSLKAPVTVKFYVSPSDKMPAGMKTLEADAAAKLEEFRLASGGKFQYKILHLDALNALQEEGGDDARLAELSQKGIEPFQVQSIEADEVGVKLIYSSMSIAYKEKPEEVLPRVMPENLDELEYLIVSKIYRMTLDAVPKVALMAPYQDRGLDPQMQMLMAQLTGGSSETYREDAYELLPMILKYEGYDVSRIRLTEQEPIPEDVQTLAILEPASLTARQRYEISRFLAGGGSVFMAVQNYEYEYRPQGTSLTVFPSEKSPGVNELLGAWGLTISPDILMDEQHETISISGAARLGPFDIPVPVKLPMHVVVVPAGMNDELSITSRLASLFYLWGTAVRIDHEVLDKADLQAVTLFESGPKSWEIPFKPGPQPASALLNAAASAQGPFPLAVLVQGVFKDPYAGQDAPAWTEAQEAAAPAKAENPPLVEKHPGKLILTGASSLFQKQLAQAGGHLSFFLNAMDALTLGEELVKIRSKRTHDRTIGHISTPAKLFWRLITTLLVPLLFAAAGILRFLWRRQTKENYLRSLKA